MRYLLDTNAWIAAMRGTSKSIQQHDWPIRHHDRAIVRRHGLTLVTHNTHEFARVPGLLFEDWQKA
jgi:predicted nucleic acid-binding protein